MTDAEFASNPNEWPRWPILPLKHRVRPSTRPDWIGAMVADEDFKAKRFKVYVRFNLFRPFKTLDEALSGLKVESYASLDDLFKDWKID